MNQTRFHLISRFLFLSLSIYFFSGCAGLVLQESAVYFDDPLQSLNVVDSEPTVEEKEGIELRFQPNQSETLEFNETMALFSGIKNGKGKFLKFKLQHMESQKPAEDKNFIQEVETIFKGTKGNIHSRIELDSRGRIIKFMEGSHRSPIGKFEILDWARSEIFPVSKTKIGERWTYEETMSARVDSLWVKDISTEPFQLKATSELEGFALVNGIRCAKIKTLADQKRKEHLKVLFKNIHLEIETHTEETHFWDYLKGRTVARITKTTSYSEAKDIAAQFGQSQSVYVRI